MRCWPFVNTTEYFGGSDNIVLCCLQSQETLEEARGTRGVPVIDPADARFWLPQRPLNNKSCVIEGEK